MYSDWKELLFLKNLTKAFLNWSFGLLKVYAQVDM
jgi:hypothetical protein